MGFKELLMGAGYIKIRRMSMTFILLMSYAIQFFPLISIDEGGAESDGKSYIYIDIHR